MFRYTQKYYDHIYDALGKDYAAEVGRMRGVLEDAGLVHEDFADPPRLLDIACGTGRHLEELKEFDRCGVDGDLTMLEIARERCPDVSFVHSLMLDINPDDLGEPFDVVTCLYSSISYLQGVDQLHQAISLFASCLKPGGILLIEPFLEPQEVIEDSKKPWAVFVDEADLKLSRANYTKMDGRKMNLEFHYLIAEDGVITRPIEEHELWIFTRSEFAEAFREAGLEWRYLAGGISGRGLHMGRAQLT